MRRIMKKKKLVFFPKTASAVAIQDVWCNGDFIISVLLFHFIV